MSDHQEDTTLLEYFVAGLVVLLFGLLYFFINHGFDALPSPGREFVRGSVPAAPDDAAVTNSSKRAAVSKQYLEDKSVLVSDTENDATEKAALAAGDVPPKEVETKQLLAGEAERKKREAKRLAAAEKWRKELETERLRADEALRKLAETKQLLANETAGKKAIQERFAAEMRKSPLKIVDRPEKPAADKVSTDKPAQDTQQVNTVEMTFKLPDGTEVNVADEGFEGDAKNVMIERTLNDPLLFDAVSFESGSSQLVASSQQQIRVVAALMHTYPDTRVLIRGHTDNTGEVNANSLLSLTRSDSMRKQLVVLGIERNRIKIEGVGPFEPLTTNETEVGRRKNRRIELLLIE